MNKSHKTNKAAFTFTLYKCQTLPFHFLLYSGQMGTKNLILPAFDHMSPLPPSAVGGWQRVGRLTD